MDNILVIIGFIVVAILILIMVTKIQTSTCASCGEVHFFSNDLYKCDECGRPFCSKKTRIRENNSVVQNTRFSSISSSITSTVNSVNNPCGVVYHIVSNTEKEKYVYRCNKHKE